MVLDSANNLPRFAWKSTPNADMTNADSFGATCTSLAIA
jgi:hypothetical protein